MSGNQRREELQQALKELVEEGQIIAVEEIDPRTGKTRYRYYHRDFAPKPH